MNRGTFPELPKHFDIQEYIGQGGMGRVFLVHDKQNDRQAAVKVIFDHLASEMDKIRRFDREYRFMLRLSHPNVVQVYDYGRTNGKPYIVMEYVRGKILSEWMKWNGEPIHRHMNKKEVHKKLVSAMLQVLQALNYIHSLNIIHRDVKPGNIMVTEDGTAKVMDFGVARDLSSNSMLTGELIVGSPAYLSPEKIKGSALGPESDLYAVGVLLYKLCVGCIPFDDDSMIEMAMSHMHRAPMPALELNSQIPETLNWIIMKLLEKEPENRFRTADELAEVIRRWIQGKSADALLRKEEIQKTVTAKRRIYLSGRERRIYRGIVQDAQNRNHIVITGEQGIGKTTLADFMKTAARQEGYDVLSINCLRYPLSSFDLLGNLLSGLFKRAEKYLSDVFEDFCRLHGAIIQKLFPAFNFNVTSYDALTGFSELSGQEHRRFLFDSLTHLIKSYTEKRRLAVFIDNFQWADSDSIDFFNHIMQKVKQFGRAYARSFLPPRFFLCIACRLDSSDEQTEVKRKIDLLQQEFSFVPIKLERLTKTQIRNFLVELLGSENIPEALLNKVMKESEGVPLYIHEMLKQYKDEGVLVPTENGWRFNQKMSTSSLTGKLRDILDERFLKLTEEQKRLLEFASVIGRSFDFEMLKKLSGMDESLMLDRLEEVILAGIIAERREADEYRLDFHHSKFRDYFYENLLRARKRKLHLKLGHIVERQFQHQKNPAYAFAAFHFTQAGKFDAAVDYYLKAGNSARANLSFHEAVDYYRKAHDIFINNKEKFEFDEQNDHDKRLIAIMHSLGEMLLLAGRLSESKEILENAFDILLRSPKPETQQQVQLTFDLGELYYRLGERTQAEKMLLNAYSLVDDTEEKTSLASVCESLGKLYTEASEYDKAEKYWDKALKISDEIQNDRSKIKALTGKSYLNYFKGNMEAAESEIKQAHEIAEKMNDPLIKVNTKHNLALVLSMFGRYDEAFPQFRETARIYEKSGMLLEQCNSNHNIGIALHKTGKLQQAETYFKKALKLAENIGRNFSIVSCHYSLALLYTELSRYREAIGMLQKAEQLNEKYGFAALELRLYNHYAFILYRIGDLDRAELKIKEGLKKVKSEADTLLLHKLYINASKIYYKLKEFDQAARYLEKAEMKEIPDKDDWVSLNSAFHKAYRNVLEKRNTDEMAELYRLFDEINRISNKRQMLPSAFMKAEAEYAAGKYEEAANSLIYALEDVDDNRIDDVTKMEFYELTARALEKTASKEAEKYYKRAAELMKKIQSTLKDSPYEKPFLKKHQVKTITDRDL